MSAPEPGVPFVGHDPRSRLQNLLGWVAFVAFLVAAVLTAPEGALRLDGPAGTLKIVVAVVYLPFFVFSAQCAHQESLLRVVKAIFAWRWGKQVVADLYLSMLLTILLLAGHLGPVPAAAWALPIMFTGNLGVVPLLWLHLDGLWLRFL